MELLHVSQLIKLYVFGFRWLHLIHIQVITPLPFISVVPTLEKWQVVDRMEKAQ